MIDIPTLLGCSAAFFAVISSLFLLFWVREGRASVHLQFGLPFFMALFSTGILVEPGLLPGQWGNRLGAFFILLAYGFGWQAIRALRKRPFLPLAVLLPPFLWLIFSATVVEAFHLYVLNAALRALIICMFNGLAALELRREGDDDPASRSMLFWLFTASAAIAALRVPLTPYLPSPLGAATTQAWAVIAYNLLAIVQALLVSALIIAMSRERVSLTNYRMATIDTLTGLLNRRAFDLDCQERAESEGGMPLALLLFDLDWFKSINDRFGHDVGDEVIIVAARTAEKMLRRNDRIYRIGGEEFVCLLPDTTVEDAISIAERLRVSFQVIAREISGLPIEATISIGVAGSSDSNLPLAELVIEADQALYKAKGAGRNQTFPAPIAQDEPIYSRSPQRQSQ